MARVGAGGGGADRDVALDPEESGSGAGPDAHDDVFDTRAKKVYHPSYGPGVVLSVEGKGAEARVLVRFAGAIRKKIVAKYLKWEDEESV